MLTLASPAHQMTSRRKCPACQAANSWHYQAHFWVLTRQPIVGPDDGGPRNPLEGTNTPLAFAMGSLTTTDRIALYLLKTAPHPQRYTDILKACEIPPDKNTALAEALNRLSDAGIVEQVGRGLYRGIPLDVTPFDAGQGEA